MEKKKNFWNENFFGFALKNILIALAIIVGLAWGSFILINIYTNHGKTEQVPNLKGLSVNDAKMLLSNHGLKMEIIDSLYTKDVKLGAVIDQNPTPKSIVKPGRTVYLVVNSKSIRQVAVPPVVDVSLRQADAMLASVGITIESVSYAPSDYKDLVLEVLYKGKAVVPGTKLPEGSHVVIVAGNGTGGEKSQVPALKGLDFTTAKITITTAAYTLGGVIYDDEPVPGSEDSYYVYKQRPAAGDSISTGAHIDIWLSKDKNKKDDEAVIKAVEKAKIKQEEKKKSKDIEDFF